MAGSGHRFTCSPQQARDLAAALPRLAAATVSQNPLPAVLAPVCQAYSSMLQLLQLTHIDTHGQQPGSLTLEGTNAVTALHASLKRTVLGATQLRQVCMADLCSAVHVAVQYSLALPSGKLAVPPPFLEAVRLRVDGLVASARGGATVDAETSAQRSSRGGDGGDAAEPLDAKPLVGLLRALCRDLAGMREAERASGSAEKKHKGRGITEAWLVETTALLMRSSQPGAQVAWDERKAAVQSVQKQLVEATRELDEAKERKRQAVQARIQQPRPAAGTKRGKAAAKEDDVQQAEAAAAALLVEEEERRELVGVAKEEVDAAERKLAGLGVACLREQLEAGHLVKVAKEVAEAAAGAVLDVEVLGVALEDLLQERLRELRAYQVPQALSAVSSTRHTLSPKTLSSVLGALGPQLDELTHGQQMQLVRVLSNPGGMPAKPIAAGFLAALTHAVSSSRGGLGSAPSELLFAVVGAAARWGVPLDQGWLEEAEQELVGRLAVEGGAPAAGAMEQPVLRQQLLRGIIAPLATLGQELSKPDLFVCALEEWRGRASKPFPGLDPDTAALLLGWAARGHGWQPTPQLHKAVESLASAAVRLPLDTPEELARMLLVASRAVDAAVPRGQGGDAPSVPAFLTAAVKQELLSMKPTVNDLASAVAALYGKPRPSPDHALLKRMLDMAQPQLACAGPLSYAQLLAGCVAAGWRPDDRWLAEHHATAAKALRARREAAPAVPACVEVADALLQLLSALSAPALAPQPGSNGAYPAARKALLMELAECLLWEPALASLVPKPDQLVEAVRQLAVQDGLPDEQWVQQMTDLTQDLIPQLSTSGLASAAEGMALLGTSMPASVINALLAQAGEYDMASYDPRDLGLLLGGVHRLRQAAIAEAQGRELQAAEDSEAAILSAEAQEVWGRAHAAFLPHCLDVLPTYTPAQKVMVAGSVVAFVMAQPAGGSLAVHAAWLSGLLLQCRACGALPPPALLVDLLRLGSRVLDGERDGGIGPLAEADPVPRGSGAAGRARSRLLSYVQESVSGLAKAPENMAPAVNLRLLRAVAAAGIRPGNAVLQKYARPFVESLCGSVSLDAVEQGLANFLGFLEDAITFALLPALPWVPEGPAGEQLARVLEAPALLQACSSRQLALLCTYATQSGLGTQRMWQHMGDEVQARGGVLSAAMGGASSAADGFAVCYALEVAAGGVAGSGVGAQVRPWLEGQLQGLDAGSSEEPSMTPLQALHVLWVAHRLGCLPQVAPGVWAAAHAATDDQLRLLLPYQLAQLVELRAAAAAAGLQLPPAPEGYTARVLHALLQWPEPGSGAGATTGTATQLVQGIAAVRALAYLPAQELGKDWEALVSCTLLVFERCGSCAAGRITSLSAFEVAAWVVNVGQLPLSCTLSVEQLQGIAKVLARPAAGGDGARGDTPSLQQSVQVAHGLLQLSPKAPGTLQALSPLLSRVQGIGAGSLAVDQLSALASAIIAAGGKHALPRAAAAVLVQLLSCEGVIQQLSADEVLQVVRNGLAGLQQRRSSGLPNTLAHALLERLSACGAADMSPLLASCLLYSCGASSAYVRQAARSLVQSGGSNALRTYTPDELLGLLNGLASCGIKETVEDGGAEGAAGAASAGASSGSKPQLLQQLQQLQAAADAVVNGGRRGDTPVADVALEAFRLLAAAARSGSMQLKLARDEKRIATLMRTAVALERRLEGLQAWRAAFLDGIHEILERVDLHGPYSLHKDAAVWDILDAAFSLGAEPPYVKAGGGGSGAQSGSGTTYWQLLTSWFGGWGQRRGSSPHGPFLMSGTQAGQLGAKLCGSALLQQPGEFIAVLRDDGADGSEKGFKQKRARIPKNLGTTGAEPLAPRHLALAIGLVMEFERRKFGFSVLTDGSAKYIKGGAVAATALWKSSMKENDKLAAMLLDKKKGQAGRRADPDAAVRVIAAMLEAAEPVLMCGTRVDIVYDLIYDGLIEARLMSALSILSNSKAPPLPDGVTHMDDLALLNSPYRLDGTSLLADLRRPPGTRRHPLVLPTHLRTAACGSPSPEQEAYVRSIAPAFEALRRLLLLARVDGRMMRKAHELQAPWLSASGGEPGGKPGRWAVLLGLVVQPERTCGWLAGQEVGAGGKEAGEALVKEKTAELLGRVPWAGHRW